MRTSKNTCSKNLNALSKSSIFLNFFNLFLEGVNIALQSCLILPMKQAVKASSAITTVLF